MNGSFGKPRPTLARRILAGTTWAFTTKVMGMTSGLAINACLARLLPPEQVGVYFLAVSTTMFAAIVARFGFKQTIVHFVAESMAKGLGGRAGGALRVVFVTTAFGSATVASIMYCRGFDWLAASIFDAPAMGTVGGLLALWIAVLAFQTPVAETFRGIHDIRLAAILDGVLASVVLAAALGVALVLRVHLAFQEVIVLSVLAAALSLVVGGVLLAKCSHKFKGDGEITAKDVVCTSAPVFVINVAAQAISNFSLWVVGAYLIAAEVAVYGAVYKLVSLVALPLLVVNLAVQPFIAELNALKDKTRLQNALQGTATLAGIPALFVLGVFVIFSGDILSAVYGEHYRSGSLLLVILSLGQLVNVWAGSCGIVLMFTGHQRQYMQLILTAGLILSGMTLVTVRHWGMTGVALTVVAGQIIQNLGAWMLVHHHTGLWTHASLHPTFVKTAISRLRIRG